MKRLTALMLTIVFVCVAVLSGCGLSATDNSENSSSTSTASGSTASGSSASAGNGLKVGFIYIGSVGDVGYTFAHDQGRKYLETTLKDKNITTLAVENVPETAEVEKSINNLIDQGCKAIFATSYGYMDFVEKAAKEHPDVKFFHCSGYKSNTTNFVNYFGQIEEGRYLSGIVAGLKTKTNKVGYVAAMQIPEVIRGIDFFTLGVRSVNPDAVVNVKWTNTWYDPQVEKDAATALLNEGNDVIAQHQDSTASQIAAQEKNAFAIGYNSDSSKAAPKAYLTAPVWNWGVYYVDQVQKILDGTWKAENYLGGMKDGVVDIGPMSDLVDADIKAKVEEAKKKILDGSLNVLAGPIKDQTGAVKIPEGKVMTVEEQQSCKWFVEGVNGKINK
ncbi:BMP family ABC transporter substrate-binding protein [Clostridium sp. BNL1100]|uniref:BMP family ABC transporter substrate-binding protein n=1 Tax=Clostridium sp. BNL1100 TaxID=755731 RepID=UPI00024A7DAD|nr:BMP family ABC transporter substrate-binding protein [Clostridium sp. BNL1100]AEY65362.1 putative ABC-type transport system, periplasmic component/surface lipoprotein [Clostridium sp. BNL1100]